MLRITRYRAMLLTHALRNFRGSVDVEQKQAALRRVADLVASDVVLARTGYVFVDDRYAARAEPGDLMLYARVQAGEVVVRRAGGAPENGTSRFGHSSEDAR